MLYLGFGEDLPASDDRRAALREQHVAYLHSTPEVVVLGGALSDKSDARFGSCLIVSAPDFAGAKTWFDNEPWAKAGLFKSFQIMRVSKQTWHPEVAADEK
jgi:uncharacterized protein YciI